MERLKRKIESDTAADKARRRTGILVVAAAGNDYAILQKIGSSGIGTEPRSPSAPSTSRQNAPAFTSRGPTSSELDLKREISARGVDYLRRRRARQRSSDANCLDATHVAAERHVDGDAASRRRGRAAADGGCRMAWIGHGSVSVCFPRGGASDAVAAGGWVGDGSYGRRVGDTQRDARWCLAVLRTREVRPRPSPTRPPRHPHALMELGCARRVCGQSMLFLQWIAGGWVRDVPGSRTSRVRKTASLPRAVRAGCHRPGDRRSTP